MVAVAVQTLEWRLHSAVLGQQGRATTEAMAARLIQTTVAVAVAVQAQLAETHLDLLLEAVELEELTLGQAQPDIWLVAVAVDRTVAVQRVAV